MAGDKRTVKIDILGDSKSVQGAFKDGEKSADSFGSKLAGIGGKAAAAFAVVGAAAVAGLGALSVKSIMAASDFEESLSKVNVVFGESAGQIEQFAQGAAQNLGMSSTAALSAAGTFGNLFVSMGMGQKPAADMSTSLLQLSSDLASFNNMDPTEVLEKLRAGLTGETEPLKSLGINLNAAAIEAKAMEMGLADLTGELSPAAKAQAAYALIMEQTATAQGDFARTKDGVANSMRIIKASLSDVTVQIGQRLLPVVTPLIVAFASKIPAAAAMVGRIMDWLTDKIRGPTLQAFTLVRDGVLTFIQALRGNWTDDSKIHPLHRAIGRIGSVIREQVIPFVREMAGFFQDRVLPVFMAVVGFVQKVVEGFGSGGLGGALRGAIAGAREFVSAYLNYLGGLAGIGQRIIDWIAPYIPVVVALIGDMIGRAIDWLQGEGLTRLRAATAALGASLWSWVQENIGPLLEQLGSALTAARDWLISTGIPLFQSALAQYTGPVLEAIGEVFVALLAWIRDTGLPMLLEAATALGVALYEWVAPIVPPLLEALGALLAQLGGWIVDTALPTIIEHLLKWGEQFIAWVGPQIPPLLAALGDLLVSLGNWLIDTALPEIIAKLSQWASEFVAWVAPQIPPLLSALGDLLGSMAGWMLNTALPEIIAKLVEWGTAFLGWVAKDVLPFIVTKLAELLTSITGWITGTAVPEIVAKLVEWGKAFLDWIANDVLPELPGKLAAILTEIGNWVINTAGDVAGKAGEMASSFVNGFADWVYNNASGIISAVIQWIKDQIPSWEEIGESLLPWNWGGSSQGNVAGVDDPDVLGSGALPGTGGGVGGGGGSEKPVVGGGGGVGTGGGGHHDPTHPIAEPPAPEPPPYSTLQPGGPNASRGAGVGKGGGGSAGVVAASIPAADMSAFARIVAEAVESGIERGVRRALSGAI